MLLFPLFLILASYLPHIPLLFNIKFSLICFLSNSFFKFLIIFFHLLTSGSSVSLQDAKIGEIGIEKSSASYKNTAVLPRGITLESSYDDVIKAYGIPQVNDGNSISYIAAGNVDNCGKQLEIAFDDNTKIINSIKLKNIPIN